MDFRFSNHALEEMQRRKIPIELVEGIIGNPQQILKQDEEKSIYQSQIDFGAGKLFLLRVFMLLELIRQRSSLFIAPVKLKNIGGIHENQV